MASQSCTHIGSSDHRQTHYIHLLFHKYQLISTNEKKTLYFLKPWKQRFINIMSWKQWSVSITMTITFSQKNERTNQNIWVEHGLHWEQKFSELFQGQKEIEKSTWVVCLTGSKPSTTWYEY